MKILCESLQIKDDKIVRDAAAAWKKERSRAFIKGCLFALLSIAVLAVVYCSLQWFSTADENDLGALARQAAHYPRSVKLQTGTGVCAFLRGTPCLKAAGGQMGDQKG